MKKVTKVILFLAVFVLHWGTQFLAWASEDAIRSTNVAHLLWRVLATPLLEIAGSAMNEYFWLIMPLNSLVWATALTWFLTLFAHEQR
jgi:hypothetical protein